MVELNRKTPKILGVADIDPPTLTVIVLFVRKVAMILRRFVEAPFLVRAFKQC